MPKLIIPSKFSISIYVADRQMCWLEVFDGHPFLGVALGDEVVLRNETGEPHRLIVGSRRWDVCHYEIGGEPYWTLLLMCSKVPAP